MEDSMAGKIASRLLLAAIAVLVLCAATNSIAGWIFLYPAMPLLWILWLVCAFDLRTYSARFLALMWVGILVTALGFFTLLENYASSLPGPSGADIALLIIFAPMFIPLLLIEILVPPFERWLVWEPSAIDRLFPIRSIDFFPNGWIAVTLLVGIATVHWISFFYVISLAQNVAPRSTPR